MKPVEIEFLVKDSTKEGARRVSASVDRETMKILGRMNSIQAKIEKLRKDSANALDQSKNIAEIKKLEGQMDKLSAKMAKMSAQPIGPSADEIAKTTRQYNGLNMSIQQMARELPALAIGPSTFFLAISNNLPIFTDELARARKEYNAMTAAGKTGIPVWKQIASSIVSPQTALAVGIMLLVTYSDEIANWVKNLFKGKKALDATAVAMQEYNDAMAKGRVNAAKELSQAETLLKVATDESRAMDQRREAAEKMQQLYPDYLGNMSTEAIMVGDAANAYAQLSAQLIEVAQSRAAMDRLSELAAAKISPELEAVKKASEAYDEAKQKQRELTSISTELSNPRTGAFTRLFSNMFGPENSAERNLEKAIKDFSEKYGIEGKNIIEINKAIEASEQELINAVTAFTDVNGSSSKVKIKTDIQSKDLLLQAQQDLEDAQISVMKEGYEKRRAVAKMEFERQLHDIKVNRNKLLEADKKEAGGKNADKINTIFDAQIYAAASKYNDALQAITKEEQTKQQKAYSDLLTKYETYQEGRLRIAKEFDKEINLLTKSPENRRMAEQAKEEALREYDVAFASQFPQFEQWANSIVTQSVDKLRELIALAEHELESMDVKGADPEAVAILNAKIATLEQRLAQTQGKSNGKSYEEWEKLSEVLGRVNDDLREVGDSLGGVFGQIIKTAGNITTSTISIISGIKELTKQSAEGVTTTATAGANAIKKLERASVILTVISAGLSIFNSLADLYDNTESSLERNIRLADEFNEELRVMNERARISTSDDSIFGNAVYENFRRNIDVMRDALQDLEKDKKALLFRGDESLYGGALKLNPWASASESLANMRVQTQHSTWFRSSKYASLRDLVPELFGDDGQVNMDALKKFADDSNITFQKLSYENQQLVKSMVSDWETYEQALESVRDYLSSIFGDLGDTILDSMVQVADGTMSATDAMVNRLEALSDTVRQFAKNMIYAMTIGPLLDEAQERIEKIYTEAGTDEEKYDAALAVLSQLMTDVNDEQKVVNDLWAKLKTMAKEQGIDLGASTSQSAKEGALHTVSQDSFTRMEGIITAIQAHVASGDLKLDNITKQMILQLDALNAIAINTAPISQIYALIMTIQREGLKVV